MTKNRLIATLLALALLLGLMPGGVAVAAEEPADSVRFYLKDGNSEPKNGPYMTLPVSAVTGDDPGALRPGYTFKGWSVNPNGSSPDAAITPTAGDTYYASWETGYKITFVHAFNTVANVTEEQTLRTDVNGKIASLPQLKDGSAVWSFAGWCLEKDDTTGSNAGNGKGDVIPPDYEFEGETTVYAKWTRSITVKFDAKGKGSSAIADGTPLPVAPKDITGHASGTPLKESEIPKPLSAQGYIFDDWVVDLNGVETRVTPETPIVPATDTALEVTVYAKWTDKTVGFSISGIAGTDYTVEDGESSTKRVVIQSNGTFYITGKDSTTSVNDVIVVAEGYHPTLHLSNLNISGATANAPAIFIESGAQANIELIGRNTLVGGGGYAGLQCADYGSGNNTSVTIGGTGSLTVSAGTGSMVADGIGQSTAGQFVGPAGKVTINGDCWIAASGANGGSAIGGTPTYTKGVVFAKNTGTVYGTNVTIAGEQEIASDKTLTVASGQTVTFEEGLKVSGTLTVSKGGTVKCTSLTGSGALNLYNTDSIDGLNPDDLTGFTTIKYAPYTITFNANGGTLAANSGPFTTEETTRQLPSGTSVTDPTHPAANKEFSGWYTSQTGGEKIASADLASHKFNGDTTLYARWDNKALDITFNPNGGTFDDGTTAAKTKSTDINGKLASADIPADPSKADGSTFAGWYTLQTGGTQVNLSKTFTNDETVWAHWTPAATGISAQSAPSAAPMKKPAAQSTMSVSAPTETADSTPDAATANGVPVAQAGTGTGTAPTYVKFYINNTDSPNEKEACLTLQSTTGFGGITEANRPWPMREGYEFANAWTGDPESEAAPGSNSPVAYAKWNKEITITLDYGDFTIKNDFPNGVDAVSGDKLSDPKLAELKEYVEKKDEFDYQKGAQTSNDGHSYKFEYWYLDDPEVEVTENTVFTEENCTLHIKWKKCPPFMVYFVLDEGGEATPYASIKTNAVDMKEDADGKLVPVDDPQTGYLTHDKWPADFSTTDNLNTRNGFTFNGWRTKNNAVMPDKEKTGTEKDKDGKDVTYYERDRVKFTEDTYLYAIWGAPYLVTYNANGGRFGSSEQTIKKTDDNNCFVDPRDEMDFVAGQSLKEWQDEDGKVYGAGTPVTGPLKVHAVWAAPFAITLDAGDGAKFEDTTNVKNDNGKYYIMTDETGKLLVLPDPKRGDDLFDGWYIKTETGEERVELNRVFEAPATIYAKWAVPHTITFNVNSRDGYFLSDTSKTQKELTQKTELDGKLAVFPEVRRDRSKFLGWYTAKAGGDEKTVADVFEEDTTLYAHWKKDPPYDIVFHANGGTFMTGTAGDVTETTAMDGKLGLKAPADPGRRGYTFTGWYDAAKDGELIAKDQAELKEYAFADDADLYAQWSNLEYTITFDFNLASIDKNAPVLKRRGLDTTGQVLQITRLPYGFYKEYELKGWYTTSDKDPKPEDEIKPNGTKFTKGVTVYAHWEKSETYTSKWPTVYFHEEEGKDPSMGLEVWENSKLFVVPDLPAKSGYDFGGWYDGSKFVDEETVFTEDAHVWAKWYKICTVTFNANGGEVDPESGTTVKGKLTALPTPVREGYEFGGWYTAAEKGKKVDLTTEYETDTTIYAHWDGGGGEEPTPPDDPNKPDDPGTVTPQPPATGPFTITFDANGGSVTPASTTTGSDGKLSSYPTPRRLGSIFEGWYNGNTLVNTTTVFKSDTTLQAHWSGGGGSSGGSSGGSNGYTYTVYTPSNSGGRVSAVPSSAYEGERVTVTVRPNSGYEVSNVTVTDSRGREVTVRSSGNNAYYFYMPPYNVTVDADFRQTGGSTTTTTPGTTPTTPTTPTVPTTPTTPGVGATSGDGVFSAPVMTTLPMPYTDVPQSAWYYTSVDYMWKRSLMGGVSATKFGPAATTSRAMIWTILARLGGVDVTTGGVWYETARSWAMSYGVSDGVDPNSPVTREDLVAMIWRFSGSPAASYDLGRFGDRGQIETYQGECAFRWAAAQGLVNGDSSRLNPQGTATRAEVAAIMTRFCQSR